MIIKELLSILESHDSEDEVKLATNRASPFEASIRGVVKMKNNGPVHLCEDYDNQRIFVDPWQELDGPLWPEYRKDD